MVKSTFYGRIGLLECMTEKMPPQIERIALKRGTPTFKRGAKGWIDKAGNFFRDGTSYWFLEEETKEIFLIKKGTFEYEQVYIYDHSGKHFIKLSENDVA